MKCGPANNGKRMNDEKTEPLTYKGTVVDMSPGAFGKLTDASKDLGDRQALHHRMVSDGYLFFPSYLDRQEVISGRMSVLERLANRGAIDSAYPLEEGVLKPEFEISWAPELAKNNAELLQVVYGRRMIEFYEFFLGGPIRHFDYTRFRAKAPSRQNATQPHCDIVFMGRGTKNLYTSWTPFCDIPYDMGGLMILEGSHLQDQIRNTYGQTDVDAYCANEREVAVIIAKAQADNRELTGEEQRNIRWESQGHFKDAIELRADLGGRWLSAEYHMGDLLVFGMYTMHASTDNQTRYIRLSSDTRYQLASEPVDERWIGNNPITHTIRAKRSTIC